MNENDILKFTVIMGGANVRTPRNIKDLKMAELNRTERIEDSQIYIKKAFDNLEDEEIETLLKMIFLDYVKPTMGLEITDYFRRLSLESIDYLLKHKEERRSFEETMEELENFSGEE